MLEEGNTWGELCITTFVLGQSVSLQARGWICLMNFDGSS